MSDITTRAGKGEPLTHPEVDANFTNLDDDKYQAGDNPSFGNITVTGTVDGRDLASDGSKLDGIEALADVTDTTNVTAAGALMDSELTDIAAVKALDQGVATTDSPEFDGLTAAADATIHGATVGRGAGAIISNTAVGNGALDSNTTGNSNTANGNQALVSNTTGISNIGIGSNALQNNTTGNNNTVSGRQALKGNTTGNNNTANGNQALFGNTTGNSNTANGTRALVSNTTGTNNIGIGLDAGRSTSPFFVTTQDNRIVLGNNTHTHAYIKIAFTVTSDARDKAELAPIPHGLDFVNALQPTEYQFKAGGRDGEADGIRRYGFLAQDVLEAEGDDPVIVDAEDPESLKLHESYLVPVLVNAVQELTEQVNNLKAEVAALKEK